MHTYLPVDRPGETRWVGIPFPIAAGMSLRAAGNMRRGEAARRELYRELDVDPERVHTAGQIHSQVVALAGAGQEERSPSGEWFTPDADGLVAGDRDAVLGITVADCMPILMHDRRTGAHGLLHSGWRGTGILARAVSVMGEAFGTIPADLTVTFGPCISARAYETDEKRATGFAERWGAGAVRRTGGRWFLDLRAANEEICARTGVGLVNIVDHCTASEPVFGSYRREGPESYTLMLVLLGGTRRWGVVPDG